MPCGFIWRFTFKCMLGKRETAFSPHTCLPVLLYPYGELMAFVGLLSPSRVPANDMLLRQRRLGFLLAHPDRISVCVPLPLLSRRSTLCPPPVPGNIVLDQDVLRNLSLPIQLPAGSNLTIMSDDNVKVCAGSLPGGGCLGQWTALREEAVAAAHSMHSHRSAATCPYFRNLLGHIFCPGCSAGCLHFHG